MSNMEQERLYDLIFIARPATPEEEIKKVITGIETTCAEKGGKIEKTEHWGTRRLAYKVAKHREGIYVYHQIRTSHGELMEELERRLRSRGTDSEEEIMRRLAKAREEISAYKTYDYCVVNEDVALAGREALAIVTALRCTTARRQGRVEQLLASFGGKD